MPGGDDIARLEFEVQENPTSEDARENLLGALSGDPTGSMTHVDSNS